ncbi:DsbA family oxidoreductase [Paenibacillus sp. CAU 1782]
MKVEIWSDYACPFCYIGKERLETALQKFPNRDDVEVVYKSFELDPNAPQKVDHDVHDMLSSKYGMSREQAISMNNNLGAQAKEVGLNFQFDTLQLTNTFDAHRLSQYAAKQGKMNEVTHALFQAYFTDSLLLGDKETLVELGVKIGLERDEVEKVLAGEEYAAQVRADEEEARRLGVTGVPFFVFDRKYAVSGAQSSGAFLQTLEKAWSESRPLQVLNNPGNSDGADGCSDGSCSIN